MEKKAIIITGVTFLLLCTSSALVPFISNLITHWNRDPNPNLLYEWDDEYTEPGLYSADEEIRIDNITYTLETYAWRDFMPICPPDGQPLIIITYVQAMEIQDFPVNVFIERIWIIDGETINSSRATAEHRITGNTFEMVFREGPKWGPLIAIDVVVKLILANSSYYYLKACNQWIEMTS